ncbi:MAG TPA: hypothetical protein VKD19_01485 [Pseudolabrys sp.]|nr:hypothetical protein [Pseudolabrys sp.]
MVRIAKLNKDKPIFSHLKDDIGTIRATSTLMTWEHHSIVD